MTSQRWKSISLPNACDKFCEDILTAFSNMVKYSSKLVTKYVSNLLLCIELCTVVIRNFYCIVPTLTIKGNNRWFQAQTEKTRSIPEVSPNGKATRPARKEKRSHYYYCWNITKFGAVDILVLLWASLNFVEIVSEFMSHFCSFIGSSLENFTEW